MDRTQRAREVSLKELWFLLLQRLWLVILVPVLCVAVLFGQQALFFTPEYESTATLYILKQENETTYNYTSSDFSLALDVVNDCTYILKSHAVLDEVIDNLNLDISYDTIYDSIETNNPSDTRVLEVTVTTTSSTLSKQIADEVCIIGAEKIADAMGFEQVNLYERGLLSNTPSNQIGVFTYLLIAVVAAVLTYLLILVVYIFDDTLDSKEEIERVLGVSVIGEIPNYQDKHASGYGKYGYGYGYGRSKKSKKSKKSTASGESEV